MSVDRKEEIEQVFLLTRVMYKAVLGLHFKRREQKQKGQLAIFSGGCMLIGYARVSTNGLTRNLQLDSLKQAGCSRIFTDHISGTKAERPGLTDATTHLRAGDTLVVWRLDRLRRSLRHSIDTITELEKQGMGFCRLQENIATTSSGGTLIFHVFRALPDFERDLIRERTQAGLPSVRSRGRVGGRPKATSKSQAEMARKLYADKSTSVVEMCKTLGISRVTLWRSVTAAERRDVG